jgi:hypothetical protein
MFICNGVQGLQYEKYYSDNTILDIRVKGVENAWEEPPVNPPCRVQYTLPYADIYLPRDELSRIKHIRFYTLFEVDRYEVDLDEHFVALRPADQGEMLVRPLSSQRITEPLRRFLLPEETIALFVPGAPSGAKAEEIESAIRTLARERGLTPVEELVHNFKPGMRQEGVWFYVDYTGQFYGKIMEDSFGRQVKVGRIKYSRKVRDVAGHRTIENYLDVYARLKHPYE